MDIKRTLGCALLLGVLAGPLALSAASTGLTIQPVKISHTLEKGQSITGSISLSNASEEAVKVEVKIEDFIPNAGGDGVKFVSRAEGLTTVRDWITLNGGTAELTLQKGEQTSIPYTINAPQNAEPGSHLGVAFFKAINLADADKQLKVGTQVGTLIFVTVPGNYLQKGQILEFKGPLFAQSAPISFTTKFENTGTVHFEPKGVIKIKNLFGKTIAEVPVEGQVVLPTGIKDLTTVFATESFLLGRYVASIELRDGEGSLLSAKDHAFYVFPVWYTLGFIALLLGLFFGFRLLASRVHISVNLKGE
ncbi:MAG: hypothetical protein AAB582_02345 [Patescibacteria group bacterium]